MRNMDRGGGLYHHALGVPMRAVTVCAAMRAMTMKKRMQDMQAHELPRHQGKEDDRGEVRFPAQHTVTSRTLHVAGPPTVAPGESVAATHSLHRPCRNSSCPSVRQPAGPWTSGSGQPGNSNKREQRRQ